MALERGFKSDANATAREIREELGLSLLDRLDPWQLAAHLQIPVTALSEMEPEAQNAVHRLHDLEPDAFSALTVFHGSRRWIVHNDAHSLGRQASDLAHELAHALLHHPPTPALDENGCRDWNQDIEDEANWLAGAMLITEDAALSIVRKRTPLQVAAQELGVSMKMMQWRINVTGARSRVARSHLRRIK